MTEALATKDNGAAALLERVVIGGNLAELKPHERMLYYRQVCESAGLNPLTRPFEYLSLNGKLVLYAKKECTEQLRSTRGVSITRLERQTIEGVFVVTASARDAKGRMDVATGAVSVMDLKGEAKANAMMKAETKAKRRVTLSLCGLGMLDESELESVPGIALPAAVVDQETGEVTGGQVAMDEREQLLAQAKDLGDALGLKAPARASMWAVHVGPGHDPTTAPIDKLQALVRALGEQAKRERK